MAEFTKEQLEEIANSEEYQSYLKKAGDDETNLSLTHYLQNALNEARWVNYFAGQKGNVKQEENVEKDTAITKEQEDKILAEHIEEIVNSQAYKDYLALADKDESNSYLSYSETNLSLTHYLQNRRNRDFWLKKFTQQDDAKVKKDVKIDAVTVEEVDTDNDAVKVKEDVNTNIVHKDNKNDISIVKDTIKRGYTSDEWQQLIDGKDTAFLQAVDFVEGVEITALKALNKLPDNFQDMSPDERQQIIKELSPVELAKFNSAVNDAGRKILETYPPRFLVFLHEQTTAELQAENNKKEPDKQAVENLERQKDQFLEAMKAKLNGYLNGAIIIDLSNVADVYEGASEMFAYIKDQYPDNAEIDSLINKAQERLDASIRQYDELYGFDKIKNDDGAKIEDTFEQSSKLADEYKFENDPELQQLLESLQFEKDEDKQIFITSIKEQAARETAVRGKGLKEKELQDAFKQIMQESVVSNVGNLIAINELLNSGKNIEPRDIDPDSLKKNNEKAIKDAMNGKKIAISSKAIMAYSAGYVNTAMGWLNRLANRKDTGIGTKAPVLQKMYAKIKKLDNTCIQRFGNSYTTARSYTRSVFQNMLSQGINQTARYGINAACMLLGQPGLGAPLYATFYGVQAGLRLRKQYKLEKAQNGGKINFWKFLGKHTPEIACSALAITATCIGGAYAGEAVKFLGQALPLDRCLSYAGMAVGGVTSLVKGYRASRKSGKNVWKSLTSSLGNTALSTGTAMACGYGIGAGINAVTSEIHFDGIFGEHATRGVSWSEYEQNAVNDPDHYAIHTLSPEDGQKCINMSAEELNQNGFNIETAEKGDDGAFLVKQGSEAYIEHVYPEGTKAACENILKNWYAGHEDLLESRKDILMTQANMSETDAVRCIMIMHDAGMEVPAEQTLYNEDANGNPFITKTHNMTALGEGWSQTHGISQEQLHNLANLFGEDGQVNQEGLKAFNLANEKIGIHNTVGHVDGSQAFKSSPLGHNAYVGEDGHVHEGYGKAGNDRWTTYADSDFGIKSVIHEAQPDEYAKVSQVQMQQEIPMTTTFDRFWGKVKSCSLLSRIGANGRTRKNDQKDIMNISPDNHLESKSQDKISAKNTAVDAKAVTTTKVVQAERS